MASPFPLSSALSFKGCLDVPNSTMHLALAGELHDQLERRGKLPLDDASFYAAEIVLVLEYLRDQKVRVGEDVALILALSCHTCNEPSMPDAPVEHCTHEGGGRNPCVASDETFAHADSTPRPEAGEPDAG